MNRMMVDQEENLPLGKNAGMDTVKDRGDRNILNERLIKVWSV